MEKTIYDVIIIGGGPAGLTAAIYTSRAFLKTLLLAGDPAGGQLVTTTEVENFPGFPNGIQGPELISNMRQQAEKFATETLDANVEVVSGDSKTGFDVRLTNGDIKHGKSIIVATGASARWLNIESETRLRGKGVSACATCDGFFFKNKVVAVVGGGDSAMEEADFLTKFASKVYSIVRSGKAQLRASKFMLDRVERNPKVSWVYNSEVIEVLGESSVTGMKLVNNETKEQSVLDDVQGLFIAIGHTPNTSFLKNFIELEKSGYVSVQGKTGTSKEGVFVCGDVSDPHYRQAITAAGVGCMAALDAQKFLASQN